MAVSPNVVEVDWTVEDYLQLDNDRRYELLEGKLLVTPAPTSTHQHFITQFGAEITIHVRDHSLGRTFDAPFDVFLADNTVVQPDLTFVADERVDDVLDEQGVHGPPDLVVEVMSPSTEWRDRHAKRRIYADQGVDWLVFADPEPRVVEVFHLQESGKYLLETTFDEQDAFEVGLFPDLAVPLEACWPPRDSD